MLTCLCVALNADIFVQYLVFNFLKTRVSTSLFTSFVRSETFISPELFHLIIRHSFFFKAIRGVVNKFPD